MFEEKYEEIKNWLKNHNIYSLKFYKNNAKIKRWIALFATSFVSFFLILVLLVVIVANAYLNKIDRPDSKIDVGPISQEIQTKFEGKKNIMFYGIDSRNMSEISRSDSIMLVTVDFDNKKVKLTSIARDTRVDIEGYGKDKLNHAFAYGWNAKNNIAGGAELSIKTINNNFSLNVQDYVTANFWALATIIDYVGGVEIEISESVKNDMNKNYIPHLKALGINCEPIQSAGKQLVTGGQAVAFCRVRYVDGGDVGRGQRQREVIMSMFEKVKSLSVDKYPKLVDLVLKECSTSLSNSELTSLGWWALQNYSSLQFENLGIPTSDLDHGEMIGGVWYYTYDLNKATQKIHDFILKTNAAQQTA